MPYSGYGDFCSIDGLILIIGIERPGKRNWASRPEGVEIDAGNGKVYIGGGIPLGIVRANLDESDSEVIIDGPDVGPRDIGLDLINGKIYWADSNQSTDSRQGKSLRQWV